MTSPGNDKPTHEVVGYETVHSRGSSFGQGLDEKAVRQMLMGQEANPIQEAVAGALGFLVNIGTGLANAVSDLFGRDRAPMSPLWEEFSDEAFKALEPLYSQSDRAIDEAQEAQGKAEALTEQLTGSIEGDFSDAIENYHGALGRLAQSVDAVTAQIPEVTQAADAVAQAQQAVDDALRDLTVEIDRTNDLADRVDQSSQEYQDQVDAANAAAERVEDAVADYTSRISDAERILTDMQAAREETSNAAQEVQGLVGTPEWDEAVSGFIYWQDQLNSEQSDFNQGVSAALAALEMVQSEQSVFNQGVRDALWVQDQVNLEQSDFNQGVSAALDALAMVEEEQSDFNQGVRTAIDALETFANLQDRINNDVRESLEELSGLADVSQIHWHTQEEYNQQNNEINRSQTEALMLHENQLVMLNTTRPRGWSLYSATTHTREPWVVVRIRDPIIGITSSVEVTALGSWSGRLAVSISFYDQGVGNDSALDQHDWIVTRGSPEHRTIRWNAGAVHMGIRNVKVTVFPYWGNERREFLLKPDTSLEGDGYGFRSTEAYVNDLEGNPISWDGDGTTRFNWSEVVADTPVLLFNGSEYVSHPPGRAISPGTRFRATGRDLVKFTET